MSSGTVRAGGEPAVWIRPAALPDLPAIVGIYNQAVEDGASTCDLSGFSADERREWFLGHRYPFGIWVAEDIGAAVAGWVALSPFIDKPCFRRTALSATYVERDRRGRGIGTALRRFVLDRAREHGLHSVVARLWATNDISVKLTEQLGYRLAGVLKEVVSMDGRMLDVLLYQRFLGDEQPPDGGALVAGPDLAARASSGTP